MGPHDYLREICTLTEQKIYVWYICSELEGERAEGDNPRGWWLHISSVSSDRNMVIKCAEASEHPSSTQRKGQWHLDCQSLGQEVTEAEMKARLH